MRTRTTTPIHYSIVLLALFILPFVFAQEPSKAQPANAAAELKAAAQKGDVALLRSQLQSGVSPDAVDAGGHTALMVAAKAGQTDAMKVLVDAGANVNARSRSGMTALIEAAEEGQTDAARLLIQCGADLNVGTRIGTALEVAERAGHNEIAAMLRQAGARTFGRSVGDTVCVRPWAGDGYCGIVESIDKNEYRIRVTQIVGCKDGCAAKAECSENKTVGDGGITVGSEINTLSSCLTHTGVRQ